jgi:UDP-glucose 4-epimerase
MTWLITGGAGYIGAHVAQALVARQVPVVVLDDLSTGDPQRVPAGTPLVVGSVTDSALLTRVLAERRVSGVVHLAAKKQVAESVADPLLYYRENVGGCESLLRAMTAAGVDRLVFSSSAAVYGSPDCELVDEHVRANPINPYGYTKAVCERMIHDLGLATGLQWVSLRYFNVAGAAQPELADGGVFNLIPLVFQAVSQGRAPRIFGADYPTPDGTCIRDFIHVADLADAHLAAVQALLDRPVQATYNVGRGRGSSVREVLAEVATVTGLPTDPEVVDRRPGDPARVVADPALIAAELGWQARRDLHDMVASAWDGWRLRAGAAR